MAASNGGNRGNAVCVGRTTAEGDEVNETRGVASGSIRLRLDHGASSSLAFR